MKFTDFEQEAFDFAKAAHDSIGQKRKYSGEPYWVHPEQVARLVKQHVDMEDAVAAAFLHDVIEDVWPVNPYYSIERIELMFGRPVAAMVLDLTDVATKEAFPKLNRKIRKEMEVERWARVGDTEFGFLSQSIKIADLICNTIDITAQDPNFAVTYLREKADLMKVLTRSNRELYAICAAQLEDCKTKI